MWLAFSSRGKARHSCVWWDRQPPTGNQGCSLPLLEYDRQSGRRRVRREKRFFCSPRRSPVSTQLTPTTLTCTASDLSNELLTNVTCFFFFHSWRRCTLDRYHNEAEAESKSTVPCNTLLPKSRMWSASGSKKRWRPRTATERSQRGWSWAGVEGIQSIQHMNLWSRQSLLLLL